MNDLQEVSCVKSAITCAIEIIVHSADQKGRPIPWKPNL